MIRSYTSHSPKDTTAIAIQFLREYIVSPILVLLQGNVGSGKSVFIRSCLELLCADGSNTQPFSSPSFSIINEYEMHPYATIGRLYLSMGIEYVYHIDLYRINSQQEFQALGITEQLEGALMFIEWSEHAYSPFMSPYHLITMQMISDKKRKITQAYVK